MAAGKLFLLPNLLHEEALPDTCFPPRVAQVVPLLQGLIAESEKQARRYLRRFLTHEQMKSLPLQSLNEHTKKEELEAILQPLREGQTWGLISDAGLPCIADPGADLVFLARQNGVNVEAVAGPSSIIMALQLSGFSGQRFAFHGYLPREVEDLEIALRKLEEQARFATQIWIEAPYRSSKMLDILKNVLQPQTKLCIATDLTMPEERVVSQTIAKWRAASFPLAKSPCVFLLS